MRPTIFRNSALCTKCNVEVESKSESDPPVSCSCGNITLRGGTDYTGRTITDRKFHKDTSEYCQKCIAIDCDLDYECQYEVCDCGQVHCWEDKWD